MEKNKIITSLTLAGILTAGVLGGNSNAASNSQGVCKNIISGESLVPYILGSADDVVTSARIKAEYTTASSLELKYTDRVRTSDTFITATGKKVVLVYGDVNQDGKVTTLDASYAQNIVLGAEATELQKAAADVRRNNNSINVTTVDASAIQEFVVNGGDYVNVKPVGEKDEVKTENEYNLTVKEGKINNQTAKEVEMTLTPKTATTDFKNNDELTVVVSKLNEETGKYAEVPLNSATDSSITLTSDLKEVKKTIDFTKIVNGDDENGTYKIELKRGEKVVADATVTTNIYDNSVKADVSITRVKSYGAQIGLMGYGEGTIAKVYCLIGEVPDTVTAGEEGKYIVENGIAVAVSNNQILPAKLFNDINKFEQRLPKENAVVSYVLEDSDGNLADIEEDVKVGTVLVANDTLENTPLAEIDKIEAKDDTGLEFTVTTKENAPEDTVIKTVLYRDGAVVTAKEITVKAAGRTFDTTFEEEDFNKPGKYTVKAYVAGTTDNQPSAVIDSKDSTNSAKRTIPVSQLDKVAENSIAYDIKNEKLTWNYADNDKVSFVVTLDDGEDEFGTEDEENKKVRTGASLANPNTIYTVKVIAKDTEDSKRVLASEVAKKEIYKLDYDAVQKDSPAATIEPTGTAESIVVSGLKPMDITGVEDVEDKVTYRVEAWEYVSGEDKKGTERVVNKKLPLTKTEGAETYEVEIKGLKENRKYDINIFAVYNKIESTPVSLKEVETITSKLDLAINHKVGNDSTKKEKDRIYIASETEKDADGKDVTVDYVYINGNKNKISAYTTEYQNILYNVVANLNEDDHIKVNGKNIEITVGSAQEATMELGSLKGYNVTITGNNTLRTINAINEKPDSLKLVGNFFKITALDENDDPTTLTYDNIVLDGAELVDTLNNVKYKIAATGKKSTINNIDVTAKKAQAEVELADGEITLTAGSSDVEFVNKTGASLDVIVVGEDTYGTPQSGSITIDAGTGAELKADTTNPAHMSGALKVNVKGGTFTLNDPTVAGTKTINVTTEKGKKSTIVFALKDNVVPFTTTGAVLVKDVYGTDIDTFAKIGGVDKNDEAIIVPADDKVTVEQVKTFIKDLKINESANATISVADGIMTLIFDGTKSEDYATVTYTVPASLIK